MALKLYLRVDGLRGESKARGHIGDIEILGYSINRMGVQGASSASMGRGPGSERQILGDWSSMKGEDVGQLQITKYIDSTSGLLTQAVNSKDTFDNVIFFVEQAGPNGVGMPAWTLFLDNARAEEAQVRGVLPGENKMRESIVFSAANFMFKPGRPA